MALLVNKKARSEYTIRDTFLAGMMLSGAEVKSLRNSSGSLTGSYVKILGGEAFLLNAQITPYKFADNREYDPKRTRKLLLRKKEINRLEEALSQKGLTLVPLSVQLHHNLIKLEVGIGQGLKQYEKREKLKKRTQERDIQRMMKDNS